MIMLGITGPIGHGKTTLSELIKKHVPSTKIYETSQIITEIANEMQSRLIAAPDPESLSDINEWIKCLPEIIKQNLRRDCSFNELKITEESFSYDPVIFEKLIAHIKMLQSEPELVNTKITRANKNEFRPLLQWIGGYLIEKIGAGVWWEEVISRMKADEKSCKIAIGSALRYPAEAEIFKNAGGIVVKIYRPSHVLRDGSDPTERERDLILPDVSIINNGNLLQLKALSKLLILDINEGNFNKEYISA